MVFIKASGGEGQFIAKKIKYGKWVNWYGQSAGCGGASEPISTHDAEITLNTQVQAEVVRLEWETNAADKAVFFEVEHSING